MEATIDPPVIAEPSAPPPIPAAPTSFREAVASGETIDEQKFLQMREQSSRLSDESRDLLMDCLKRLKNARPDVPTIPTNLMIGPSDMHQVVNTIGGLSRNKAQPILAYIEQQLGDVQLHSISLELPMY